MALAVGFHPYHSALGIVWTPVAAGGDVRPGGGQGRFRARVPGVEASASDGSRAFLGCWYATLPRWRPEVALFVNESTLLPVMVALAPARTLLGRFPTAVAEVLGAHHVPGELIDREVAELAGGLRMEPTTNRGVVGVMNEFSNLADAARGDYADDLLALSVRLAATPCGPLYRRHVSPDRELASLVAECTGR